MGNSVSGLLWGEEEGRPSEGANKGGQDAILPLTQKKRSLELEDAEEQRLLARKRLEFMQLAVEQLDLKEDKEMDRQIAEAYNEATRPISRLSIEPYPLNSEELSSILQRTGIESLRLNGKPLQSLRSPSSRNVSTSKSSTHTSFGLSGSSSSHETSEEVENREKPTRPREDIDIHVEDLFGLLTMHVVEPSDTLEGIALKYDVKVPEIMQTNNLWNANELFTRKQIVIPKSPAEIEEHRHKVARQKLQMREELVLEFMRLSGCSEDEARMALEQSHFNLHQSLQRWNLHHSSISSSSSSSSSSSFAFPPASSSHSSVSSSSMELEIIEEDEDLDFGPDYNPQSSSKEGDPELGGSNLERRVNARTREKRRQQRTQPPISIL